MVHVASSLPTHLPNNPPLLSMKNRQDVVFSQAEMKKKAPWWKPVMAKPMYKWLVPIPSMYVIYVPTFGGFSMVNAGRYAIHGCYGV